MRIYLADLGHNVITATSDVYPLGVANLASYAQANINAPMSFSIFREPKELKEAIDTAPPDVLGVSSYSWNHRLSTMFARYAKAKSPAIADIDGRP